ncbi:hypothetical protein [Novosphingobium mangrovi (ex Huang et al. 2023)]|uniref:Tat pathway signal protein n=1 Tax=Novosphingobium mangrovi (ex Huang et al. 2023) TaxID=2976432 RepID=A0ABT2I470_9SPHN|nr:hypothetical protein [Novosphingobium mangrovi (ex Huang et al. 2023)]MCT2399608.1 hypothetical protein [Novosphingobium mangrovi (ex Huang et al. 2023)]
MTSKPSTNRDRSPIASPTSRRALLGTLSLAPVAVPAIATAPNWTAALRQFDWVGEPATLHRTRAGRSLSRARYHNAEQFFASIEQGIIREGPNLLYHTGIVMQLGLSAHLLDVGFEDQWCARHVGLHIDRSLALANATGLGLDEPAIDQLACFVSPYGKWRHADIGGGHSCPWSGADLQSLTRQLLDHVRAVTGHARPTRGRQRHD